MIDEANQSLEESGTPSHEIMVIVLHREFTAGSIGITLAGGADYESKDITVRQSENMTNLVFKFTTYEFYFKLKSYLEFSNILNRYIKSYLEH